MKLKLSELNKLFPTEEAKREKIVEICGLDTKYPGLFYDDLNEIHAAEQQFLEILVEESHWLTLTEVMNFNSPGINRGFNIGHWPAECHERADAFLITMIFWQEKQLEKEKQKDLQ